MDKRWVLKERDNIKIKAFIKALIKMFFKASAGTVATT